MNNRHYILITPVKNEENNLKKVIKSVLNQTQLPFFWIIVNDGSTDNSKSILDSETKHINWVKIVNKTINKEYNWLGYSRVINEGINNIPNKIKNVVEFIAILDSDITLEKCYFEKLIESFNTNTVGVVCGRIYIKNCFGKWEEEYRNNLGLRGGARMYKKKFLDYIGGFPKTPSPDTISDIKLRNHGLITKVVKNAKAFQHRASFGKQNNLLKGFFSKGRSRYILNFKKFHVLLIALKMSFTKKPYILSGLSFIMGYFTGYLSNQKRINDPEIIEYSTKFWDRII